MSSHRLHLPLLACATLLLGHGLACAQTTGYTARELTGLPVASLYPERAMPGLKAALDRAYLAEVFISGIVHLEAGHEGNGWLGQSALWADLVAITNNRLFDLAALVAPTSAAFSCLFGGLCPG